MDAIAFVTGADRGLGLALAEGLVARGWQVFAGQYMPDWPALAALAEQSAGRLHIVPLDVASAESAQAAAQRVVGVVDHVDLLINNAGVSSRTNLRGLREGLDYGEMHRLYDINALGPLRMVEAFLPLTDKSAMKRLCFVSSEAGSIGGSKRTAWFGYCTSKAALNMIVKNMFNYLRPEGYTFRLYHPGWMRTYMGGAKSTTGDMEPEEAAVPALAYFLQERSDEECLVLRDWQGGEWSW